MEDCNDLAERVQQFELDEPGAALSFTRRLARDNRWTIPYAQRVVREYKRFALLAASCEHPITPSDQVDQAWHLHLTYSDSYARFCAQALCMSLRHCPTQGGAREQAKFRRWYERTLQRYRERFGEEPPRDIWPPAEQRFSDDLLYARIHTGQNWIIRKPAFLREVPRAILRFRAWQPGNPRLSAIAAALAVGAAGCSLIGGIPPFDLTGERFLAFFAVTWLLSYLAAWALASRAAAEPVPETPPSLSAYEVAYLSGGTKLGTAAAIASLVKRGALVHDPVGQRFGRGSWLDDGAHGIEHALWTQVLEAEPRGCTFPELERSGEELFLPIANRLRALRLLGARATAPLLVALIAPALGMIKIGVGLERDKPVSLLVLLCIGALLAAWLRFWRVPHRSPAGETMLQRLREEHAGDRGALHDQASDDAFPIALAVALFGVAVLASGGLAHPALAQLHEPLQRSVGASSGGSGGCSTGGDGGGDGGGGGCGGCGCGGCGG